MKPEEVKGGNDGGERGWDVGWMEGIKGPPFSLCPHLLVLIPLLICTFTLINAIHRLQSLHAAENQLVSIPPPFSWKSKGLRELVLNNNNISTVTLCSQIHKPFTCFSPHSLI